MGLATYIVPSRFRFRVSLTSARVEGISCDRIYIERARARDEERERERERERARESDKDV